MRSWFLLALACSSPPAEIPPETFLRVGVDVEGEAREVEGALTRAGYTLAQRIDGEGFVALSFVRATDDHRAIRIVTRVGVAVLLDSHESDGVRERHGAIRLLAQENADVDGDGRPEIVVARDGEDGVCLAVLRIAESGRARAVRIEAGAVADGACACCLEDVDGDGRPEALVDLSWPELAIGDRVPSVRAALVWTDGAWIANGTPDVFAGRERAARAEALSRAREANDVATASRIGIELAAIANMTGATIAAQLARYDEAIAGLAPSDEELPYIQQARARIAAGWAVLQAPDPADVEEGTER